MNLYSWNINGLRAIIKKPDFANFLSTQNPDILLLQETKINQTQLEELGLARIFPEYQQFYSCAAKKGYSGTAVWVKKSLNLAPEHLESPKFALKDQYGHLGEEGRLTIIKIKNTKIISAYVPNSKDDLTRLKIREEWDKSLADYLKEQTSPTIIAGDFNVAHHEIDLARPKENEKKHGYTKEERAGFEQILSSGLIDTFRHLHPDEQNAYTWWTHWGNARARNVGWRIDYFLISKALTKNLKAATTLPQIYGSDHCPVKISIDL